MDDTQLDLFSWDIVRIGEGFRQLSKFDFEGAISFFDDVLTKASGHYSAVCAKEMLTHWEGILQRLEYLEGEEALAFLWNNIKEFSFSNSYGPELFRRALIEKLIQMLDESGSNYIPSDLCSGYLHMKLGDYKSAEQSLNAILCKYPHNGRLLGYLGDALWMQERKSEARAVYAKALLSDSSEVSFEELRDEDLFELIEDEGAEMAPVYGWLRGMLPLLDVETEPFQGVEPHKAFRTYEILSIAEKSRQKGDHEKMVSYRKMLKREAPEIFDAYMKHLKGILL